VQRNGGVAVASNCVPHWIQMKFSIAF